MEQGAVPTQRAKSSVLKFLQHRIVPSGCLAKRSTIGQDMHSPRASAIEQSAARKRTVLRTLGSVSCGNASQLCWLMIFRSARDNRVLVGGARSWPPRNLVR
jgi:hypothetical protein